MAESDVEAMEAAARERFSSPKQSATIYSQGVVIHAWYGKPAYGILFDDTRLDQQDGESYTEFRDRIDRELEARGFSVSR